MTKLPPVEYHYDGYGVSADCAYHWALFLARESEIDTDDPLAYDRWMTLVEQLTPKKGVPRPAAVFAPDLMEAIERYTTKTA